MIREILITLPHKHNGTHMPCLILWAAGLAEILSCKCTGESAANKAESGMLRVSAKVRPFILEVILF